LVEDVLVLLAGNAQPRPSEREVTVISVKENEVREGLPVSSLWTMPRFSLEISKLGVNISLIAWKVFFQTPS